MNAKSEQKDKRSRVVLGIIILLLFVVNGVLIYQLIEKENKREELAVSNEKLEEERQSLLQDIDQMQKELVETTGENEKLDSMVREKNALLEAKLAELRTALNAKDLTQRRLAELELEKQAVDRQLVVYRAQIDSMRRTIAALEDTVTRQKVFIEQQIEDYTKLEDVYQKAQEKVRIGSRLSAINIEAAGIRERKRGEREVTRLRRADKVRVNFMIDKNEVADKGMKDVYLKLLSPTKGTMYNEEKGSGKFTFNGEESLYTLKKKVNFQNTKENVEFIWEKGESMVEGEYEAFIIIEDHIVGRKSFELK